MPTIIATHLQQIGLKQTRGRSEILRFLELENAPVDVADIVRYLQSQKININQATVYRILDIFVDKGITNKLEFQEGKFRYEIKGDEHHHLICNICGGVEDVSNCNIDKWKQEIFKKNKFEVKSHSLEFFGVCKKCQS